MMADEVKTKPRFWKDNTLTLTELQRQIGQLQLQRLGLWVDTSVLGEVIIRYRKPQVAQIKLRSNLKVFKRWLSANKPVSLTVRYIEFDSQ